MASRYPLVALVLMLALMLAQGALGQERPEPSAADKETARQLMDIGNAKYRSGDYQEALEAYQGADKIMGVSSTGLGVGKALAAVGRLVEARDKLLAVSRLPATENESPVLTRAREEATELQRQIAGRIPQLTIQLRDVPPGAQVEVRVDGEPVAPETLSLPRAVDPGKHSVTASGKGIERVSEEVALAEGEKHVMTLTLEPAPIGDDGSERETSVSPLVYAGFAVAGAGVVAGAITGGISLSIASGVKDECVGTTCPSAREDDGDRSLALAHASTVSFAIAGAGAIVGAVGLYLTFGLEQEGEGAAGVSPRVGPGYLGLSGRF